MSKAAAGRAQVAPLQRPLPRGDRQINSSSFAFLFAEMISYFQQRITTASDLENRWVRRRAGLSPRTQQLKSGAG